MKATPFTRQRVILGGVMALAFVGLLMDRFVLRPAAVSDEEIDAPAPAIAQPAAPVAQDRPAPVPVVARPTTPEAMLAVRLSQLAGPMPTSTTAIRDIFARGGSGGRSNTSSDPAGSWQRRVLSAVMLQPDGRSIAVVDGKLVPLGGWLDGLRLVRLTQDAAVFSDATGRRIVTLRARDLPERN